LKLLLRALGARCIAATSRHGSLRADDSGTGRRAAVTAIIETGATVILQSALRRDGDGASNCGPIAATIPAEPLVPTLGCDPHIAGDSRAFATIEEANAAAVLQPTLRCDSDGTRDRGPFPATIPSEPVTAPLGCDPDITRDRCPFAAVAPVVTRSDNGDRTGSPRLAVATAARIGRGRK
jgi:hypothetical protein